MSNKDCMIFYFILGNIAEEGVHVSTLPDHFLNQQPTYEELISHARTAEWNVLSVKLGLNSVDLAECHDCTRMYQVWIMEKGRGATRRSLLNALRDIRQNNVADTYEDYLKTRVSYIEDKSRTYLNNELCEFSHILSILGLAYVKNSNITKCGKI